VSQRVHHAAQVPFLALFGLVDAVAACPLLKDERT
jgi:hypothetical protein